MKTLILRRTQSQHRARGQALVEYALILALLAIALGIALAATGPAIGNVFGNTVFNLIGQDPAEATSLALLGGAPDDFWKTVTWVAQNPQAETPYAAPVRPPSDPLQDQLRTQAAGTATYQAQQTSIARTVVMNNAGTQTAEAAGTATANAGGTATVYANQTQMAAALGTFEPSPTPPDVIFQVPHVDQINSPQWWRLDESIYLGTSNTWQAEFYQSGGAPGASGSGFASLPVYDPQILGRGTPDNYRADFNFNWGTGMPLSMPGWTATNNYGVRFTRTFTLDQAAALRFTVGAEGFVRLLVNGAEALNRASTSSRDAIVNLNAGAHVVAVEFDKASGNGSVSVVINRANGPNPDDLGGGVANANCGWGRTSSDNSNSVTWMFDENPNTDAWGANRTCYLELRGYVDLSGIANPRLSFWDVWDFTGAGDATARIEIADYVPDGADGLNRAALNWRPINLRSGGSANYNWTRNEIDLRSVAPALGNLVTFRFALGSTSGGDPLRWYIDDIQVLNDAEPARTFTVGNAWNLNNRSQMNDFIFNSDTNKTIEDNPALPNTTGAWRWNLTSTNARGGTGWDDSPGIPYSVHTQGGPRVHFLEFKYPIDLRPSRVPPPPAADDQGDTGSPVVSFWYAYDIPEGSSLQVQYTFDTRDTNPDSWQPVPDDGLLLDFVSPPAAVGRNEQTARGNNQLQFVEVRLDRIPGWDAQPFRLRFALIVNMGVLAGDGIYIDDIQIERDSSSQYAAFPFIDSAEDGAFTTANWRYNGPWRVTNARGGVFQTANAYWGSPDAAINPTYMEMRRVIDLRRDTPENAPPDGEPLARTPSARPFLTFWHQRETSAGNTFAVDLWTELTGTWTTIWTYNDAPATRNQRVWERVEIDLREGLQRATGLDWAAISSNGTTNDDDIKLRFRMQTSVATSIGVFVDDIRIQDLTETSHKLWTSDPTFGAGNGPYSDSIETPPGWQSRWHVGAWNAISEPTGTSNFVYNGSLSLHDSPQGASASPLAYRDRSTAILELKPIIDLRGTDASLAPVFNFWSRYEIAAGHNIRVEVAVEDPTDSMPQTHNDMAGWGAWTPIGTTAVSTPNYWRRDAGRIDTWLREQVDLSGLVGSRVRVRFVLDASSAGTTGDGWYVDQVSFTYGINPIALPFSDTAQSTANWITEGRWGMAENFFVGTGSSAPNLGATQWTGWYFDCETLYDPDADCTSTVPIVAGNAYNAVLQTPSSPGAGVLGPETVSDINFTFGTATRPMSSGDTAFNDSYAARWTRTVTLTPGTYTFTAIFNDALRLKIDNTAGTDIINPSGYIFNTWTNSTSNRLEYRTVTVSSTITRTLTLEFFENTGESTVILSVTRSSFSFTDSPNQRNAFAPSGFDKVVSLNYGNSSLLLNGSFDFSGLTSAQLTYDRLYELPLNNTFYVEVSTDGGYVWTPVSTVTNSTRLLPDSTWEAQTVNLSAYAGQPRVMLRFRLDTRSAGGGATGDGVYLANINVTGS